MQIGVFGTGLGVRGNALRAGAMLIALLAAFAPMLAPAQVAPAQLDPAQGTQALRKVGVVSFGLFGGQDVFRSEATGAAAVVASRFGGDPVVVRFNTRKSGDATIDTLVITAADRNHPSFGCEDKAKWTYFGDAFFNSALRQSQTLREAFSLARSLVLTWELRNGFEPSHPQIAGGENVEPLLVARH